MGDDIRMANYKEHLFTVGNLDRLTKFTKKRKNQNTLRPAGPEHSTKIAIRDTYKPSLRLS